MALDFPFQSPSNREKLLRKAQRILERVNSHICAVKINHHLILPLGTFDGVQKLLNGIREYGLLAIMDCKVNDIGATNQVIAEYYFDAGFDALIANPFVGWEEGLRPIFEIAHKKHNGVILITYMSHKAAPEGYGQTIIDPVTGKSVKQYISFAEKASNWKADGVIVGATYPEKIKEIYGIIGKEIPIYSPGIGAQGGDIELALKSGTEYFIIGRAITCSKHPEKIAEEFNRKKRGLERKRG